jgi:carbon monoxide dehydrogenase subunit G
MLQFDGKKTLVQDAETCWTKLSDPSFLGRCISNVESVAQSGPDKIQIKLRPGVSFVRGTLDVTIQIEKGEPGRSLRYSIHSRGIGSTSDAAATVQLEPAPVGTEVQWTVVIKTLGGLLKAVPQGLIKASAQKVITDIWSAVERQLSMEAG